MACDADGHPKTSAPPNSMGGFDMSALILLKATIELGTRRQRQIKNEINREPAHDGALLEIQAHRRNYRDAIHRKVGPCRTYNCHGLTFASRRTWIDKPTEVQKILDDDDYESIPKFEVERGDIAIYTLRGEICHSGIVVEIDDLKGPRVLSKWALLHEVIHFAWECPYNEAAITYWRVRR
jgi:hypothetical protein